MSLIRLTPCSSNQKLRLEPWCKPEITGGQRHVKQETLVGSLRTLSYVVLVALAAAFVYVSYIALTHWTGIGV